MRNRAIGSATWALVGCLAACGGQQPPGEAPSGSGIWLTAGEASSTTGGGTAAPSTTSGDTPADSTPDDDGDDVGDGDDGVQTAFDVGAEGYAYCKYRAPGIYCRDNAAVECGEGDAIVSETSCVPNVCSEGTGCVTCYAGQHTCMGPHVMECDTTASPAVWAIRDTCDASTGRGCDAASAECKILQVVGGIEPTGVYYQYAFFDTDGVFRGGYDVDSYDNRIYVNRAGSIDVYEVELLDSDGDGVMEPDQHPNNPDAAGPVEQRTLTFVQTVPWPSYIAQSVSEIYAGDSGIWVGGQSIEGMDFGDGSTEVVTAPPSWAISFSQLGYDDVHGIWYASNEYDRRVFQHHAATDAWGLAFLFPSFAGDHMDGLEVVTQPETGIPYVYVSDMTSDFIAQYRLDAKLGWVQENLFSYEGTAGSLVEGMGYGAFNHFWTTGGQYLYEVGGGDLAEFTEPPG